MAQLESKQSLCYTDGDGDGVDSSPVSGVDAGTDHDDLPSLNQDDGDSDAVSNS